MSKNLHLTIKRLAVQDRGYLFGVLMSDGAKFTCDTLESEFYKIPAGSYDVVRRYSPKFGREMWYVDVPGRSGIMFHSGNTIKDSRGCILLGDREKSERLLFSRCTMRAFGSFLDCFDQITLTIS